MWRPVLRSLASGYAEVRDQWTLDELGAAHMFLDELDWQESERQREHEIAMRQARRK